jgi:hypothetical protein
VTQLSHLAHLTMDSLMHGTATHCHSPQPRSACGPSAARAAKRMKAWAIPPGEFEQSFTRANQLRVELERKERALGRKVQVLAKGLGDLMTAGASASIP